MDTTIVSMSRKIAVMDLFRYLNDIIEKEKSF